MICVGKNDQLEMLLEEKDRQAGEKLGRIAEEMGLVTDELVAQALERGLLLNVTQGNIIRLLPPLVIQPEQVSEIIDTVSELVSQFVRPQAA